MEGASGIFEANKSELYNGSENWREHGRTKMTSDVLAVCDAANEFGIDEILYYDSHYAGNPEYNVLLDKLPPNLKLFDVPDRCFLWRRIRGQAQLNPFGVITVGQHSRYGEDNAYFPHTIQSPPIESYWVNGLHIAEIGSSILNFQGVKYIANIGCASSEKEAKELSKTVHHITVKDKNLNWEPSEKETYEIIKKEVAKALRQFESCEAVTIEPPYKFKLELCKGYRFNAPSSYSWKGDFDNRVAKWESPSFEIGSELFNYVRAFIEKNV